MLIYNPPKKNFKAVIKEKQYTKAVTFHSALVIQQTQKNLSLGLASCLQFL